MNASQLSLLVLGLISVLSIKPSTAIKCYNCNTALDGDKCQTANLDPTDTSIIKECEEDKPYCRKIDQNVESDSRIVRTCASDSDEGEADIRCVLRTGTDSIKMTYCKCEGDLCNAAPAQVSSLSILLLTAMSGILALFLQS